MKTTSHQLEILVLWGSPDSIRSLRWFARTGIATYWVSGAVLNVQGVYEFWRVPQTESTCEINQIWQSVLVAKVVWHSYNITRTVLPSLCHCVQTVVHLIPPPAPQTPMMPGNPAILCQLLFCFVFVWGEVVTQCCTCNYKLLQCHVTSGQW